MIMAMLFAAITIAMGQIVQAKNGSQERMTAFMRADTALRSIRSDLVSVLRRQDLFETWVLLEDDAIPMDDLEVNRDWILVFNNQLRAMRSIEYNGEGVEYESSWQILDDEDGAVLWHRRDALPDTYPRAGGTITPLVEGIIELNIEAWDGEQWMSEWDSDYDGLPRGFRITVTSTGAKTGMDALDAPLVSLRTVVPVERVPLPLDVMDWTLAEQIAMERGLPETQVEEIAEAIANGTALPLSMPTEGDDEGGLPGLAPGGVTGGRVSGVPEGLPNPPPGGRGGGSGFGGGGGGGGGGGR